MSIHSEPQHHLIHSKSRHISHDEAPAAMHTAHVPPSTLPSKLHSTSHATLNQSLHPSINPYQSANAGTRLSPTTTDLTPASKTSPLSRQPPHSPPPTHHRQRRKSTSPSPSTDATSLISRTPPVEQGRPLDGAPLSVSPTEAICRPHVCCRWV